MQIPYTAEPRPDTGVTNAALGMWLFVASEVMLFGSLFSAYALLRSGATAWADQGTLLNVPLAGANTAVLVASSLAMVRAAREAARTGADPAALARLRRALGVVIGLGMLFLALKTAEYRGELTAGLRPATSNFLGLYFTMTGLHALHVLGGLAANGWLWATAGRMQRRSPSPLAARIGAAAVYWNFVDVVWICMFVTLYLL